MAFIGVDREKDPMKWTFSRMWKITRGQFDEVVKQEGPSYNHTIDLGMDEGIPIVTISSKNRHPRNRPSENYVLTIAIGLIEAYELNTEGVYAYLHQKDGIRGDYTEEELRRIINRLLHLPQRRMASNDNHTFCSRR
ncbi:MAG: hypothetical protein HYX81_04905 [Chloroflexi bacterium]|nr:hypothetical protein [Chloroflexota bacterium]